MLGLGKEDKEIMNEREVPCPRCRQENSPRNRFCGSCGAPLTSGEQLATREEHSPVPAGRAWPSKLGPAGKALAVGVAVLVAEAGLSWLRHRIGAEDRSSVPTVRDTDSASRGYLLGQSLEEVLVGAWDDTQSRAFARREVRSFVATIVRHHGADR
jgi:Double zinc ribbon